jgi:acetyl-CoA carboxylase alpha subunit
MENTKRLAGVMSSYDKSLAKIEEMESYDDQLKHKYLKQTLQQINDLKVQLASDIKKFQTRQKEEREKFASMMKTV